MLGMFLCHIQVDNILILL